MKNYDEMSDFEINKLVAMHLGKSVSASNMNLDSDACVLLTDTAHQYVDFDPCNNPEDAWPIIVDNKISINAYDYNEGWSATTDTSFFVDDDNPLRAAMICFLKMKDAEQ